MTLTLLSELVVPVVGIGLSPIPIIAVILVLGTADAKRNGPAFALGWLSGLSALVALIYVLEDLIHVGESADAGYASWVRVALGIVLLVLAGKKWLKRPKAGQTPDLPSWMAKIDETTPKKSFVLGAMLGGANPKNIAFSIVAVTSIMYATYGGSMGWMPAVLFVMLCSLFILIAVFFYLLATTTATTVLARIKTFMVKNNNLIMMCLYIVFGVLLIKKGLGW